MSQTYYQSISHTFQDFSVIYNNQFFNHLPMTITSLEDFGASLKQLKSYTKYYCERLSLLTDASEVIEGTIAKDLINLDVYQKDYLDKIHKKGVNDTLKAELPLLISGISAGNFYALNRLSCGVQQNNLQEIAMGLALWKSLYLNLGELGGVDDKRPTSLLRHVSKKIGHVRFSAGNATDRMISVTTLIDFQQNAHQPEHLDFITIAKAAATIYKMSGDFTMLHSIMACYSFHQLLDVIGDKELALRYLWQAIVVAYLSAGSPSMTIVDKIVLISWDKIIKHCCESNNEHFIELCYACNHLYNVTQEEIFQQIASKYVAVYAESAFDVD